MSQSGTLVLDPARCAHLPGFELKIDWSEISSLMLMIDHLVFSLSHK